MIELRMLGRLDLLGADGQERSDVLVQPKRFALLAYLAVAGGGFVRRDTLLAVFWPDLDQAHARDALKQALSHLRRGLVSDDPIIVSRGAEELSVNPRVLWCDVAAFIDAVNAGHRETALELYRGPLLEGFFANDSPEFDDWLSRERHRLRSMAGKSAQQLAQQAEDDGDLPRALQLAERAAELSDLDERLLRQRVQLFNRAGDRAGAIRTYDDFARRLWAEHGAEPSAESHDLVERTRVRRTSTATESVPLPVPLTRAAVAGGARPDPVMASPTTRFVRTSDGVSIGYIRVGSGSPIVHASNFRGDVHCYNQHVVLQDGTDGLAALGWEVIYHDGRGMGCSDREITDWSLEGRVKDLEAVVSCVPSERIVVAGADQGGLAAIAFAARYPTRVSHLVLMCPFARGASRYELPAVQLALAGVSAAAPAWGLFTNVIGSVATQFGNPALGRQVADSIQDTMTRDGFLAYLAAWRSMDVTPVLRAVTAPTLVIHDPTFPFGSLDLCREVALGIPDARLLVVNDQPMTSPGIKETRPAIDRFLRDASVETGPPAT